MQKPQKMVACMSPGQKSPRMSLAWPSTLTTTASRRAGSLSHRAAGFPVSMSRTRKIARHAKSTTAAAISA